MDMQHELEQAEQEFQKIVDLLGDKAHIKGPIADAYTIAWRMWMRLEELRLRHPYA